MSGYFIFILLFSTLTFNAFILQKAFLIMDNIRFYNSITYDIILTHALQIDNPNNIAHSPIST
ncbi:hypothetical protein M134_1166 [Bacteroides fragilis str. S24L34]|nr:hypothetical protein M134_1166 [Bacteroides fragilis str. S24L34]